MNWRNELRRFRRARGLTQGTLAEMMNVEQPTVSRWERGVHEPDLGTQRALRKLIFGTGTVAAALVVQNANNSPFAVKVANRNGHNLAASVKAAAFHGVSRDELATADYQPYYSHGLRENWRRAVEIGFFEGEVASVTVHNEWLALGTMELRYCVSYWTPARLETGEIVLVSEFQLLDQVAFEQSKTPCFMPRLIDHGALRV